MKVIKREKEIRFKAGLLLFLWLLQIYDVRMAFMYSTYSKRKRGFCLKQIKRYVRALIISLIFCGIFLLQLNDAAEITRLTKTTVSSMEFRSQPLNERQIKEALSIENPGELLGVWMLETNFGELKTGQTLEQMKQQKSRWESRPGWDAYVSACQAIWNDLEYFPVAEALNRKDLTVSFVNSWMYDRDYGGKRWHEGTDLMPSENTSGLYPVVSMTDGTVRSMGWLELGGWRIGITAPGGAYFYYAHLSSYADLKEGDQIRAGDLLGYMGDTGYSKTEGTTGNFPVHLHLGIYLYRGEEEISVNPYPVLKYTEGEKIRCRFAL